MKRAERVRQKMKRRRIKLGQFRKTEQAKRVTVTLDREHIDVFLAQHFNLPWMWENRSVHGTVVRAPVQMSRRFDLATRLVDHASGLPGWPRVFKYGDRDATLKDSFTHLCTKAAEEELAPPHIAGAICKLIRVGVEAGVI